jgi:hypothetical protein
MKKWEKHLSLKEVQLYEYIFDFIIKWYVYGNFKSSKGFWYKKVAVDIIGQTFSSITRTSVFILLPFDIYI